MSHKISLLALAGAICVAGAFDTGTAAAAEKNFYRGKRLSIIIGFSPGGGYDTYGRMLANHIGKHIRGNPSSIVRNMPGASSMKAVKFLYSGAKQDGTVLTMFNPGVVMRSLTDPKRVDVDFSKLHFVGSMTSEARICYVWHATGIKNLDDFLKRDQVIMGATSIGATAYINAALLRSLFGAKVKHVMGYPGSAEQRIALERGELDGMCGSWTSIPRAWIKSNKIVPIVRFGKARIKGMPDLPYVTDLAKTKEKKQILNVILAGDVFGRPVAMGPDVPNDRLKIIRAAFDATMQDKAFLAEAAKRKRAIINPMRGADVEAMIRELYRTPKNIVAKVKDSISPKGSVETVKLKYITAKGRVTKTKRGKRRIWIDVNGKSVRTKISGSRTKVFVNGKKAKRRAIKVGMVCELTYLGPGTESKKVDCRP